MGVADGGVTDEHLAQLKPLVCVAEELLGKKTILKPRSSDQTNSHGDNNALIPPRFFLIRPPATSAFKHQPLLLIKTTTGCYTAWQTNKGVFSFVDIRQIAASVFLDQVFVDVSL